MFCNVNNVFQTENSLFPDHLSVQAFRASSLPVSAQPKKLIWVVQEMAILETLVFKSLWGTMPHDLPRKWHLDRFYNRVHDQYSRF